MSPKEMACVQAQIQPKSTTLDLQKHNCHLLRICFVLGSRLVYFLSHLVFLFPLRRYLGCSLVKEAEAEKGYRSKVTKQRGGRVCIRTQSSLTSLNSCLSSLLTCPFFTR